MLPLLLDQTEHILHAVLPLHYCRAHTEHDIASTYYASTLPHTQLDTNRTATSLLREGKAKRRAVRWVTHLILHAGGAECGLIQAHGALRANDRIGVDFYGERRTGDGIKAGALLLSMWWL